jgi:hypothetical protein
MPDFGNESVSPLGRDQQSPNVTPQIAPVVVSGETANLSGSLSAPEFERLAALAFRRMWMTAIGAEEAEIQEACTSLAGEISYDEELENLESVRRLLQE